MTNVITYGTFDLLHKGHVRLLERAKSFGDKLIVGLSTDEFNSIKGKKAYTSFNDRKYILESIQYVDKVIPERKWEQKIDDVKNYDIDIFIMGNDWEKKFDYLNKYCKVIYLPRTDGISTTMIKSDLGSI